ncbi:MAG: hypothetical protein AAF497_14220, partial [Planctomycetota bacterium]
GYFAERGLRSSNFNRWFGFAAGGVQAAAALLLLFGGLFISEPLLLQRSNAQSLAEATLGKKVADQALRLTELTRSSLMAPYINTYNPFTRFPELNKFEQMQKSMAVLGNPEKINELLQHPALQQLESRPEIEDAVAELMGDESLNEFFKSGSEMNMTTAYQLLKHPAILKLVDQPGFMEEATRIINETKLVSQL